MKVNLILKIARQVEGEKVFINAVKGSLTKEPLYNYMRDHQIPPTEIIDGVGCIVELGILEDIEID